MGGARGVGGVNGHFQVVGWVVGRRESWFVDGEIASHHPPFMPIMELHHAMSAMNFSQEIGVGGG